MARRDASAPLLHLGAYEPDPQLAPANRLVEAAVGAGARILYDMDDVQNACPDAAI